MQYMSILLLMAWCAIVGISSGLVGYYMAAGQWPWQGRSRPAQRPLEAMLHERIDSPAN